MVQAGAGGASPSNVTTPTGMGSVAGGGPGSVTPCTGSADGCACPEASQLNDNSRKTGTRARRVCMGYLLGENSLSLLRFSSSSVFERPLFRLKLSKKSLHP